MKLVLVPPQAPATAPQCRSAEHRATETQRVQRRWLYLDSALWASPARCCVKPLGETEKGKENLR